MSTMSTDVTAQAAVLKRLNSEASTCVLLALARLSSPPSHPSTLSVSLSPHSPTFFANDSSDLDHAYNHWLMLPRPSSHQLSNLRQSLDSGASTHSRSVKFVSGQLSYYFPLWVLGQWVRLQNLVGHCHSWETSIEWLERRASTSHSGLAVECLSMLSSLPLDCSLPRLSPFSTSHLPTLLGDYWLADNHINAGVDYINAHSSCDPQLRLLNSYFFNTLKLGQQTPTTRSSAYSPANLLKNLISNGRITRLLIPVHRPSHWTVLLVNITARTYTYIDSLCPEEFSAPSTCVHLVKGWLSEVLGVDVCLAPSAGRFVGDRQTDSHSCGVAVLSTMAHIALGGEFGSWSQAASGEERIRWALRFMDGVSFWDMLAEQPETDAYSDPFVEQDYPMDLDVSSDPDSPSPSTSSSGLHRGSDCSPSSDADMDCNSIRTCDNPYNGSEPMLGRCLVQSTLPFKPIPLSVIFFLLYNSPLVSIPASGAPELCIAYIDDVTLVAWGKTFEDTNRTLLDMMMRKGGAMDWSRSHNSTFELDKTALIDFSRAGAVERPSLTLADQVITPVESHVLLGVAFDQGLRWQVQCNRALAKGVQWASQLGRLAKMLYGASAHTLRRLYLSIAVPRFTYAADVWFTPVTPSQTKGQRGSGSIGMARRLGRIQSMAARAILGAMKTTPVDALDAHAGLLPIHILLNEACQRAASRLAAVTSNHPLFKAVARCARGRAAHVSPLQSILQFSGHHPDEFDKTAVSLTHCARDPRPITFPDKLTAAMKAHTDRSFTKVFADGSAGQAGVGAAAIRYTKGEVSARVGKRLGEEGTVSVLDAEVAGIWMAAHLILRAPVVVKAVIYSDSQLAIRSLAGEKVGASPSLVNSASRAIRNARRRAGGITVRLEWCPGHTDVRGSSEADGAAKAAAAGTNPDSTLLPRKLLKYRPTKNLATVKRAMKTRNELLASDHWMQSETGKKMTIKYPNAHAHTFMDRIKNLPRSRASLLFQLTTGHVTVGSLRT